MIGRLRGELLGIEGPLAIIDVAGVGYEVVLPDAVLLSLPAAGDSISFYTRQIFREDGVTLYGFLLPFQRRMFDLLVSVQGCGPKASLALIGQLGEDLVATAILSQDAKVLTRATGVGPKLAERIILELKTKMQEEALLRKIETATAPRRAAAPPDELVAALVALGYRRSEAEDAAGTAREASTDLAEQLRISLRSLQK